MFKKIIAIDNTGLETWAEQEISSLTEECYFHKADPVDAAEVIRRASDADVILVSWRTPVTKEIIESCTSLKYIGMCCSLYDEKSANVDIAFAREKGIPVLGVKDYGDEGLVEFIIYKLISLFHGFDTYQWSEKQEELTGKTLGIIGMGATGQMLKNRALAFGMKIVYFSRTRKPELENENVAYMELSDLLRSADIVSTHLPKFSEIMDQAAFQQLGNGKVFINTSLEPTFKLPAFKEWVSQKGNFAIMDRSAMGSHFDELVTYPHLLYTKRVTGFTKQAEGRLSRKVLDNLKTQLQSVVNHFE